MMKRRKGIIACLCAAMILTGSLTACNRSEQAASSDTPSESNTLVTAGSSSGTESTSEEPASSSAAVSSTATSSAALSSAAASFVTPSSTTKSSAPSSAKPSSAKASSAAPPSAKPSSAKPSSASSKTLVAYFTRLGSTAFSSNVDAETSASLRRGNNGLIGNTEAVADMIQQKAGGDLFHIETVAQYPADTNATISQARTEQDNKDKPELKTKVGNMASYNVIFIGSPNWWGTIAPAVRTFLSSYDFSGKTIIPFSTHEGSGLGNMVADIKELCPDATVQENGLAVSDGSVDGAQNTVNDWLNRIGITK